jgi:hypothetical protein
MSLGPLTEAERNEFAALVNDGLTANRQSSNKFNPLYDWLSERYGIAREDMRASLLSKQGNLTNRIQKDNAWTNPKVLLLAIEGDEVSLEMVRPIVAEYVAAFPGRLDATSRLRVVLYCNINGLIAVDKVQCSPTSTRKTAQVAASGAVERSVPDEVDKMDDIVGLEAGNAS